MNFLIRSTTHVYSDKEKPPSTPPIAEAPPQGLSSSSLENLMSDDDPYTQYSAVEQFDGDFDAENARDSKNDAPFLAKHLDVSEEDGWIAIPYSMSSLQH